MRLLRPEEVEQNLNKRRESEASFAVKLKEKVSNAQKEFNETMDRLWKEKVDLQADLDRYKEAVLTEKNKLSGEVAALERRRSDLLKPLTEREQTCEIVEKALSERETQVVEEEERLKHQSRLLGEEQSQLLKERDELEKQKSAILEERKQLEHDTQLLDQSWADFERVRTSFNEESTEFEAKKTELLSHIDVQESLLRVEKSVLEEEKARIAKDRARLVSDYEALSTAFAEAKRKGIYG